jgi:mannose-6-phosphate isomerase-like protein (cupin superfamily)
MDIESIVTEVLKMKSKFPHLIEFKKNGHADIGFISIWENNGDVPFKVERVFWTYFTPEDIVRGRHAHYQTEQVLVAVAGRIIVNVEFPDGVIEVYTLDKPNIGLYFPPFCWHTMQYSHSSVQMVLASTPYNEQDYIREYDQFKKIYGDWRRD